MTTTLVRRVVADYRKIVGTLVVLVAANLAGFAFIVYPLATRVERQEARAERAAADRAVAEDALARAREILVGRERADDALARFYGEVLPADQREARRITYLQLAGMAERANLRFSRRTFAPGRDRDSALARLDMTMSIDGAYRDMRRFIHAIETSPEFIVINQVALAQRERGTALALTLQLSTFYRADDEQ